MFLFLIVEKKLIVVSMLGLNILKIVATASVILNLILVISLGSMINRMGLMAEKLAEYEAKWTEEPWSPPEGPGYLPPGTVATRWSRHMVLVYIDARSYSDPNFMWSTERFKWLVAFIDDESRIVDFLFDGFLIIGYVWKDGKSLLPLRDKSPSDKSDWEEFLKLQLRAGVKNLNDAIREVSQSLKATLYKAKLVLSIPYPDKRQSSFGEVDGRELNLGKTKDRVEAVKWFVDRALNFWSQYQLNGTADKLELIGFYWLHEQVESGDQDVIREVSRYLHENGYLLFWIPWFMAPGVENWREIGFDVVTMQPNYAFRDCGLDQFEKTAETCYRLGMGVEMELPLYKRNPRISDWKESFEAYMSAGVKYRFMRGSMLTYYYGNAFVTMATTSDLREYYEKIYWFVKGTYPNPPPS
ncbi:TPA: DUF4855 domain-containing protein [Candidatus Bathyarchaeota archaeon]|nr:DUF4855 domain-containing protein [Candidatus Bathyarchaeota archaeon]